MNKSATIANLAASLAKAQSELKNPAFDSTNPHFKNKFASLVAVRAAVLPILNKNGLTISQFPKCGEGTAGCVNLLMHVSGEWIEEECLLPLSKNDPQGAGSAITYTKRYSLQGIAGVVADEDDDANAASTAQDESVSIKKGAMYEVKPARRKVVADTATQVKDALKEDRDWDAYALQETITDHEERVYFWSFLDSTERSRLKAQNEADKTRKAA